MRGILNNKKKMWLLISTVVVVIIALAVGIGIYNTPANRLQRQLDLGNRYLEEKRYAEATLAFDRAIAIDETCIEAYLGKAKACEGLEDYDTVVSLLEICHTLTDDSSYLERIQTIKKQYMSGSSEEKTMQEEEKKEEKPAEPVPIWSDEAARGAYEVVIKEYTDATAISSEEWFANTKKYLEKFPDVNQAVLDEYFIPSSYDELFGGDEPYELAYSYLDIDGNGISEMILWRLYHEPIIFGIYVYNGFEAVALKLGEKTTNLYEAYGVGIYTDGTIWIYHGESEYYRLGKDGYSTERVFLSQEEIDGLMSKDILLTEIDWKIFAHDVETTVLDHNLTEEDMHRIFLEKAAGSTEVYFFYNDFDGDGIHEAYGVTGDYSEADELSSDVKIYYVSPDGECYCLTVSDDFYGYLTLARDEPQGTLLQAGNHKFLLWELSANGSGSVTYVYGADRGLPYEPAISGRYMCFGMQSGWLTGDALVLPDSNTYVGYESDFSQGYHDYIPHYFAFDEATIQFVER